MITKETQAVLAVLAEQGVLLLQDKSVPSVVQIVTGESLKGSWWSHAKGRLIFTVLSELAENSDVLFVKLLGGKVTLVYRRLWPALLAIVAAAEDWQMDGLTAPARQLLSTVNNAATPVVVSGPAIKELERRLLVKTDETHTPSGRHALVAQPWLVWAERVEVKPQRSSAAAKRRIERAVQNLGAESSRLPWVSPREHY
jgi:hypothetical protein